MKKLFIALFAVAALAIAGHAQGVVAFNDTQDVNGSVDLQTNASNANSLEYASSFEVALYYLPTASSTAEGNANAYGQLTYSGFTSDGFSLAATTTGGSGGSFSGGTITFSGLTASSDVLALAAWNGTQYSTLAAAVAAGDAYGIISFVNNIGPGGTSPNVPFLTGWNGLTATPAVQTFEEGPGYPDLVMVQSVPEPSVIAMAGLGGISLLYLRRKK